jgi:hypothetical protein
VIATIGALPYVGGIVVGYFLPSPAIIMAFGMALWFAQMLTAYACAHWLYQTPAKHSILYSLTTLFTFGTAYGLAVVLVALMIRAA